MPRNRNLTFPACLQAGIQLNYGAIFNEINGKNTDNSLMPSRCI